MPELPEPLDAIGVGYCSEDTLLLVDRYPQRNAKAEVAALVAAGGGQAATAMVALRRLGMRTGFIGRVGDDDAGHRAVRGLTDEGVDVTGAIVTPGASTQQAFIVADRESGERTIFWRRPAELHLDRHDVDASLVRRARIVHVDGHERGALRALGIARASGIPTSMDAEKATDLQRAMIPLVDLLIAAESFPGNLLGANDPREALPAIGAMGPREVVVTLGARGAIGWDGSAVVEAPAFDVPAIDSTGAGDVFHAGYLYGHLQGWPMARKLRFANACAALSLAGLGGRAALPSLPDALALCDSTPEKGERP